MTVRKKLKLPLIIVTSLIFTACSTPYFGYSETDWQALSKSERNTIKSEYQTIIDARENQKYQDVIDKFEQEFVDRSVSGSSNKH